MTPKGHGVIRGCLDSLYDRKGHGDLCGRFDLVYDPKKVTGHYRSPWPTLWPKRSWWPLWWVWPYLWPQKVTGSLEVALTYFMTSKGHGVIRGRRDLLYDHKGHADLFDTHTDIPIQTHTETDRNTDGHAHRHIVMVISKAGWVSLNCIDNNRRKRGIFFIFNHICAISVVTCRDLIIAVTVDL